MANMVIQPFGPDGKLPTGITIVNDLVSGGAASPLSAEMGVNLNNGDREKELFLGTLVQNGITASGLDNGNVNRASTKSVLAVPHSGATLHFKTPDKWQIGIRHGAQAENLDTNSYWFITGSTFTFPESSRYYRVFIAHGDLDIATNTITNLGTPLEDAVALVESKEIVIYYFDRGDIIQENSETEKYVKAVTRMFYQDATKNNTLPNLPTFSHISDLHGDAYRLKRFMQYSDMIGVDAALLSGDIAAAQPNNFCQYMNDIADEHSTMLLPCIGNHDVRGTTTAQKEYEDVVEYLFTKNSVYGNPEETYPTYGYKDFDSKKIRLIILNLHELSRSQTDGCNLTKKQAEWFIATLASTPSGYGVLLMYHTPEADVVRESDYDTFYQPFRTITLYQTGLTGNPVSKIIDAFISKTTATITYTSQTVSITVSADFTSVASGVEFIAHILGHEHVDWVGPLSGTVNRQLMLDVTCGIAIYGPSNYAFLANISDLPRGGRGSTQDAFNIYSIDRVNKMVRIARVGSNITAEGKERKYMFIPYAES